MVKYRFFTTYDWLAVEKVLSEPGYCRDAAKRILGYKLSSNIRIETGYGTEDGCKCYYIIVYTNSYSDECGVKKICESCFGKLCD